ncbi:MAG: alpha/beta hydrolase [Pseudomonadota bacterium]
MEAAQYTRRIGGLGGALRLALLNLVLRLSSWRMFGLVPDVARLREKQLRTDARLARPAPDISRTPIDCDGVPAEWIEVPGGAPRRVILYLHGGAFLFRYPHTHAKLVGGWCRSLGARALKVDYRLAPEHPFPAAPDDCHAAYCWLLAQGYAASDIVLAGDSAGGNLVLATLHRIKAAGQAMPACAVVLSPFADCTLSGASILSNAASDPIFSLTDMMVIRRLYVRPECFLDPSASPLFGDFTGMPPLLVQVGSTEMLRDDGVRVAARAHAAGVEVALEIWDKMPHVFQAIDLLPQAAAANARVVAFIAARTSWRPETP